MENKKKQLLDTMKALPMTMEDKCAFVEIITNGFNEKDDSDLSQNYIYLDVSNVNKDVEPAFWLSFNTHSMICYSSTRDKYIECTFVGMRDQGLGFIAIKISTPLYMIFKGFSKVSDKNAIIQLLNSIGAKEITKDEYYNLIDVSFNDYVEISLDEVPL